MMLCSTIIAAVVASAASVTGAGIVLSSKETPIPPIYPIGAVKEPFAKPSGRLFDINGTVEYFSGPSLSEINPPGWT
jgi:hypothetical protein